MMMAFLLLPLGLEHRSVVIGKRRWSLGESLQGYVLRLI
ncbi:hypothetical protein LINGRAHAP2_LOCUS2197 [Linum grandiflorum]